MKENAF